MSKIFNLTLVAQGYILSAFVWSLLLLKVPAGALLDRFGTRSVSAAAMTLASIATAATARCPNFLSLFAVQVLMGAGQAPNVAAPVRAIRDWVPLKERAAATAVATSVGTSFGVAISAIITAWLLSWLGWQDAFAFAGAVGMIWVVCWLALFRDPSEARWLGEPERRKILQERSPRSKRGTGLPLGRLIRSGRCVA